MKASKNNKFRPKNNKVGTFYTIKSHISAITRVDANSVSDYHTL